MRDSHGGGAVLQPLRETVLCTAAVCCACAAWGQRCFPAQAMLVEAPAAVEDALASLLVHMDPILQVGQIFCVCKELPSTLDCCPVLVCC